MILVEPNICIYFGKAVEGEEGQHMQALVRRIIVKASEKVMIHFSVVLFSTSCTQFRIDSPKKKFESIAGNEKN